MRRQNFLSKFPSNCQEKNCYDQRARTGLQICITVADVLHPHIVPLVAQYAQIEAMIVYVRLRMQNETNILMAKQIYPYDTMQQQLVLMIDDAGYGPLSNYKWTLNGQPWNLLNTNTRNHTCQQLGIIPNDEIIGTEHVVDLQ